MKMTTAKRNKMMNLITTIFNILDTSKRNAQAFAEQFSKLSNDEFDKAMGKFLNDDSQNFFLEVSPYDNEPSLANIQRAAKKLGIPLEETVYTKHDGDEDNPLGTRYEVGVGYLYIKKMQQMLEKKNSYSVDINQRSAKTGQLTGDSKVARITDLESVALTAFGADAALEEFLGSRADNMSKKEELYKVISNQGFVSLNDVRPDRIGLLTQGKLARAKDIEREDRQKVTLNTVDVYFIGSGIQTDVILPINS